MKNVVIRRWMVLTIACALIPLASVWADTNLLVEFNYHGKKFSIQGKAIKNGVVFNKGAGKKIRITTLEWAPYIGQNICKQGWVQQFTVALLASQGYEVTSTFYPWARTISEAEKGRADILYPEYFIENAAPSDVYKGTKRSEHLALSERYPGGPIAFMKRKGESDKYKGNYDNLKGETIGVVRGYQNTPEFDALMDKKFFSISQAKDDSMNAKKLIAKRINLIIGDPSVIRFTVANSTLKNKDDILSKLVTVTPVAQYNHLYYAISKKKPQWKDTLEMVNRVMAEFEGTGEMFNIIKNTNKNCGFVMDTLVPYPK